MVFPRQMLRANIFSGDPQINPHSLFNEADLQPASVDCRLGDKVYQMKSSGLSRMTETVEKYIHDNSLGEFSLDGGGYVLSPGNCYVVPLRIFLNLSDGLFAKFSPKSSLGRIDVFLRVLSSQAPGYDRTHKGYRGRLYLEITPLTFPVRIAKNLPLVQMRIQSDEKKVSSEGLRELHREYGLVYDKDGTPIGADDISITDDHLYLHVDLDRDVVGFHARTGVVEEINLREPKSHDPHHFWQAIERPRSGSLVLEKDRFYLLSTKERVRIPSECCAEIVPYNVTTGEFRTHYAGFFDNGFGGRDGTSAVLEVRVHDVSFRITDGQPICQMSFEKTLQVPDVVYGQELGSNYTGQGPKLSKYFKIKKGDEVWK